MIAIRIATTGDAATLAALSERTFRDTYFADNSPADVDAYVAQNFGVMQQRAELANERMTALLVEDDGHAIAYALMHEGDAPSGVTLLPSIEIGRFYVERAHHGRGIAHQMMDAVRAAARNRGAQSVWLAVWERNHRARAFYRKLGFVDVGTQPFLLGADLQTDRVLMRAVD